MPLFSADEIADLAARASTLAERLAGAVVPHPDRRIGRAPIAPIEPRVARWQQLAADGDPVRFARRLSWDGIVAPPHGVGPDALSALVGPVALDAGRQLPSWTSTLQDVSDAAVAGAPADPAWLLGEAPVPFETVFVPFLQTARRHLERHQPLYNEWLSARARISLERALLVRLAGAAFRTLNLELAVARLRSAAATSVFPLGVSAGTDAAYAAFVRSLLADGFRALFFEYPVLARMLTAIVDQWVEGGAELIARVQSDRDRLGATFGAPDISRVDDVKTLLGDPHNGGRAVSEVVFDTGLKVIYKPRDMGPEAAFEDLLEWCNRSGLSLWLQPLRVLRGDGYGWMECAQPAPCDGDAELRRYYHRAGMLLGLVHALRGTDFHFENTLACGDQPLLVDLETMLTPRFADVVPAAGLGEAVLLASQQLRESIVSTHFLPVLADSGHGAFDLSGLGGIAGHDVEIDLIADVNTDGMRSVRRRSRVGARANSPFGSQSGGSMAGYVDELVTGYRETTTLLASRGEDLLGWWDARSNVRSVWFRFVCRPSWLYAQLLKRIADPQYLREGIDRSLELEALARSWTRWERRPALWPIVQAESAALERGDVPFFRFRPDRTELVGSDGEPIPHALAEPPWDTLRSHWRLLGLHSEAQVRMIRSTVHSHEGRDPGPDDSHVPATTDLSERAGDHAAPSAPGTWPIEEALRLGHALCGRAIVGADGSVSWIGLQHDPARHRSAYQPLNVGFYGGVGGILVFLSALARVTQDDRVDRLVTRAADAWKRGLPEVRAALARRGARVDLGAATGVGSIIYTLAMLAESSGDAECLSGALEISTLLTHDALHRDDRPGVLDGAAGAILALLKLHGLSGATEALARAAVCGRHLLDLRASSPDGGRTWAPRHERRSDGFAHGVTGIAHTLVRLSAATGDQAYEEAAAEALRVERATRRGEDGPPRASRVRADTGWCDGAAGELVARTTTLPHLDADDGGQVSALLERVLAAGIEGQDSLCCGNMGRAAALMTAADRLSTPALAHAASRRAAGSVARARNAATYRFFAREHGELDNPGLFRGDAGIGWALLRVARPDIVPCILLME